MYIIKVQIYTSTRVYNYSHSNRSRKRLQKYIELLLESINDNTIIVNHNIFKQIKNNKSNETDNRN